MDLYRKPGDLDGPTQALSPKLVRGEWICIDAIKTDRFITKFHMCVIDFGMNAQNFFDTTALNLNLTRDEKKYARQYIYEKYKIIIE